MTCMYSAVRSESPDGMRPAGVRKCDRIGDTRYVNDGGKEPATVYLCPDHYGASYGTKSAALAARTEEIR